MTKVGVLGSYVTDVMARSNRFPKEGETVKGSYFNLSPGGKGFNQAIAAKKSGADLLFSTKIGNDQFGTQALDSLNKNKIDTSNIIKTNCESTGIALIIVNETTKNNEIVVVPGACSTFTNQEIDDIFKTFKDVEYLLLQLEINMEAMRYILEKAKFYGIKVILNPAPYQASCIISLENLYLITPNETEASLITGLPCTNLEEYRKIAKFLLNKGVSNIIITLGKKGVYFNDGKTEELFDNYNVDVVDTTGAGDAFNGGLLAALSQDYDLINSIRYANVVSNLSVTKIGTSISMPTKSEIQFFLSTILN